MHITLGGLQSQFDERYDRMKGQGYSALAGYVTESSGLAQEDKHGLDTTPLLNFADRVWYVQARVQFLQGVTVFT